MQMRHELEKDIGFFERTADIVFALQRHVVRKSKNSIKMKQVPVIRFKKILRIVQYMGWFAFLDYYE